jgi:hypothetical protein
MTDDRIKDNREDAHCNIWNQCPDNITCAECRERASREMEDEE